MKKLMYFGLLCVLIPFFPEGDAISQIIPDTSLDAEQSVIVPESVSGQLSEVIAGGATRGTNLFHSFESFSIPTGQSVYFLNPGSITRIFSRVTGNTPSDIQGVLGVLGDSDLFFVNGNGISFGPEAQLYLPGGSFIASTASTIQFADGIELSTLGTGDSNPPILSSSIPQGLGLSGNSSINVSSTGRDVVDNIFLNELSSRPGLTVAPFETIALVGGEIAVDGGILRSSEGRIELASIQKGTVSLVPFGTGWTFDYPDVAVYGDVTLSQLSLVEARGLAGGQIGIHGRNLVVRDGSIATVRNFGEGSGGSIDIVATESLRIGQSARTDSLIATVFSQNSGTGQGADVSIISPQISVRNGGQITSNTFASGVSGNVFIDASNSIVVDGYSSVSEDLPSLISIFVVGKGSSGDFFINAGDILISGGGQVGPILGAGSSGNVDVVARNITVDGALPTLLKPSFLGISTVGGGTAERLSVETDSLRVLSGGVVGTSTIGSGDAGDTLIRANDSIEVRGFREGSNPSMIDSSATEVNLVTLSVVRVVRPTPLSGNAGSVSIITPRITIQDGGAVRVQNDGPGDAGNVDIFSDEIRASAGGVISASTDSGQGGNIRLYSSLLLLSGDSDINASAGGSGQGGNVLIESDGIALFPNSSITANADQGAGGRVEIITDALLRSPNSLITATSVAGPELDGTVDIQAPDETITTDIEVTPQLLGVPKLSAACVGGSGDSSEFIVTGRGGVPRSPTSIQQNYSGWRSPSTPSSAIELNRAPQITEAQGWISNGDGTVNFTDQPANPIYASAQNTGCVSSTAQNPS